MDTSSKVLRRGFGEASRAILLKFPLLAAAATVALAGCSSIERSRNLADPAVSGKTLAEQVCSNCHGMGGRSINPNFPVLAAQRPGYVVTQLKEFRGHHRSDPAGFEYMWGLSRSLTDKQIEDLADYYAAQSPAAPRPTDDLALEAEGREIFSKGVPAKGIPACTTCHGPQAEGKEGFPRLAGQHADYIVKQLNVFQRTEERPAGSVMKTVAHDLTPRHMEAAAAFLQDFKAP